MTEISSKASAEPTLNSAVRRMKIVNGNFSNTGKAVGRHNSDFIEKVKNTILRGKMRDYIGQCSM